MTDHPVVERRGGVLGLGFGAVGLLLGLVAGGLVGPDRYRDQLVMGIAAAAAAGAVVIGVRLRLVPLALFGPFFLLVGIAGVLDVDTSSPRWLLALIAGGMFVTAGGAVAYVLLAGRREKELDRLMFSESSSVAFFVTMLACLVYSLFESWLDAPALSMWNVWTFGMITWVVATIAFKRRYS